MNRLLIIMTDVKLTNVISIFRLAFGEKRVKKLKQHFLSLFISFVRLTVMGNSTTSGFCCVLYVNQCHCMSQQPYISNQPITRYYPILEILFMQRSMLKISVSGKMYFSCIWRFVCTGPCEYSAKLLECY